MLNPHVQQIGDSTETLESQAKKNDLIVWYL